MKEDKDKECLFPENFRSCSISGLNYSVDFKSTYPNEDLDYLVGKSIAVLDHLERKKDKDNNSH